MNDRVGDSHQDRDCTFYSMVDQRSVRADGSFPTTGQDVRITSIGQCRLTRD